MTNVHQPFVVILLPTKGEERFAIQAFLRNILKIVLKDLRLQDSLWKEVCQECCVFIF